MQDTLDFLFAEAKAAKPPIPDGPGVSRNRTQRIEPARLYADPENWKPGRFIALVHKETQTLLGTFQEHLHRSVPDCRRLLRVEGPVALSGTEEVSGTWGWIPPAVREATLSVCEVSLLLAIELQSPPLSCPEADLRIQLQGAGILAARLAADTEFSDAAGQELLHLPAGTNLLPVLSLETKKRIRQEIAR